MTEWQGTLVLVLLFALRCVVPLLFTLALGYGMNRLADRWERERAAAPALPQPSPAPAVTPLARIKFEPALALPCWLLRNCDEKRRAACAAAEKPWLPCWQARAEREGLLPAECAGCARYAVAVA